MWQKWGNVGMFLWTLYPEVLVLLRAWLPQ